MHSQNYRTKLYYFPAVLGYLKIPTDHQEGNIAKLLTKQCKLQSITFKLNNYKRIKVFILEISKIKLRHSTKHCRLTVVCQYVLNNKE